MKFSVIIASCFLYINIAFGQFAHFMTSGSIVFEKSVNAYGLLKQHIGSNADEITLRTVDTYKASHPQFKKYTTTLIFNKDQSLYIPDEAALEPIINDRNPMDSPGNLTYTNRSEGIRLVQKDVYDNKFLLKDSLRKINWRYTNETREIAGYTCRRANALILDSVYVVAFYTDKIHFSGGPESFAGLPGMILGIALPYENVTWFATKVTDTSIEPHRITPPTKGKPVNENQLADFLTDMMKPWGSVGRYERKIFLL